MKVIKYIYNLVDLCQKEKEHATTHFLKWFFEEKVEEDESFEAIVAKWFDKKDKDKKKKKDEEKDAEAVEAVEAAEEAEETEDEVTAEAFDKVESTEATLIESEEVDEIESTRANIADWLTNNVLSK